MNYQHIRCDSCGGIIGMYNRVTFNCEKCGKHFALYSLNYDQLLINNKTGWLFPVIYRKEV